MTPEQLLGNRLSKLDPTLPPGAEANFLRYARLLEKWNRAYNLTSARDIETIITRHVLDSLSALPYIQGERLLDIGSGAGLPGMVLALARPRWHCVLLDSNRKKTRFLQQVVLELGPENVEVVCARVEAYQPAERFPTVIARAYAELKYLYRDARPLLTPDGRLLAMKGKPSADELAGLAGLPLQCRQVPLSVPGLDAERHLVIMYSS